MRRPGARHVDDGLRRPSGPERYGDYERLLRQLEAVPVDTDRFGTLYWIPVRGVEPFALARLAARQVAG